MRKIALVAVEIIYGADIPYSYIIPDNLVDKLEIGSCVFIPFGNGNRKRKGLVLDFRESDQEGLKEIISVTDLGLDKKGVELIKYIKNRYFCTYYDAFKLLQPALTNSNMIPLFERYIELIDKGFADSIKDENGKIKPKYKKQSKIVELLEKNGSMPQSLLLIEAGVTNGVIKTLEKNGVVRIVLMQKSRSPIYKKTEFSQNTENNLNEEQKRAYDEISVDLGSGKTRLLYGVTGSGKTHVFIALINNVLEQGKGAMLLIPEISLTFQMVERFYNLYGNKLAILHSGLSNGERSDEWRRIRDGEAQVVIGTRSAVFAPLKNLGIIIIDEEQEHTYKSEMTPRYHAREVAAFRVLQEKALLLLASATPSFESFYKAQTDVIGYSELTERFNGLPLPKVITVDLQREVLRGNSTGISHTLAEEIAENLKNKEQTILFLNRRGYNSHVACPKCGNVSKCPNCGIPLTFHIKVNKLLCHYCNYTEDLAEKCTSCGHDKIRYTGVGTQKLEEQIRNIFPDIKILRMDADTVTGKNSRDEILSSFASQEYDLLLGTQMITKGLDFGNVTLVGVLNADSLLYSSDFRAYERTFSLLTQVTGRAGRSEKSGRAVIQTYSPSHEVLKFAFAQDYKGFFKSQMALRKALVYPPYCDICQVVFIAQTEENTLDAAEMFIEMLKFLLDKEEYNDIGLRIIKPRITFVPMVDGKNRSRILIKCRDTKKTRSLLNTAYLQFIKDKNKKDILVTIDINPMSIL